MIVETVVVAALVAAQSGEPWARHTIDSASRGADGVRLADANGDGLPDIVTGWEEGGTVRVTLNPGPTGSRRPWPAVTVGPARSVEDAVFADLDGDGGMDVVSCCEGRTRRVNVHWAPKEKSRLLDPKGWSTEPLPASEGVMMWMFCVPLQVDGRHGVDLVAAGKGKGAQVGWFEAPAGAKRLADWKWHPLRPTGWIMSLAVSDMDGDGDQDIFLTDRKGKAQGCFWLENPGPGPAQAKPWREHPVGGQGREVMFATLADLDKDGLEDVLAAAKPREVLVLRRASPNGRSWKPHSVSYAGNTGTAKAVSAGDLNLDGKLDLAITCEGADGDKSGVFWLSGAESKWSLHDISGAEGVKYDIIELIDLDADGDLDALTCEERRNLGVVWYENPAKNRKR
jgi:hypothetical protein